MAPNNNHTESLHGTESKELPLHDQTELNHSDVTKGDEALRLIGAERTAQFSNEYNLQLRKKLVPPRSLLCAGPVLIRHPRTC